MQAGFPTGTEPDAGTKKFRFQPPSIEELKPHFPQLEILSYIGQGGMGAVYKARQPMLDRYVALKILPPEAATDPGFTERFTREARALARLNHPNIVAVHEFGRSPATRDDEVHAAQGYHYLLMEFVDGVNLREMERTQRLSPTQALSIVPKICDALQYAHDEGVVHRDIKPENILVDKKGRVKIADFGIAKILGAELNDRITGAQHVVGTPHYMAPEQVEKPLTVDHRADIYSVGVVFYEMLTGELPLGRFAAPSKKVQIDVRLDEVVLRALEKEPEARYQQVSQLKTQVESVKTTPVNPDHVSVPAGINSTDFAQWEKRAPGWRIRCRKCGFTEDWGKFGIRKHAVGVTYKFGRCPHCHRFGWAIVERGPVVSASAAAPFASGEQPPEAKARRIRGALWVVTALLFLDFILPHSRHFSTGLRCGFTQPWLFLPHDGYGVIFNPRAVSFFSGVVSALTAITLIATQKAKLNLRYGRWIGSVATAVLIAAVVRFAVEPYKAMNDAVAPEINPGSTVFVYKLSHRFQPGDVVVYRWFATGYPTKFLLGRVAELLDDNSISIERRYQEPQKILASDVVGKVIFNTRASNSTIASPRASAALWAPSPIPTNFLGMSKILDDARNLTKAGEYEKALQRHMWYHDHAADAGHGGSSVLATFGFSDWIHLGEEYPKAKQVLVEIRDTDAEKLFNGTGTSDTFMDMQSINRTLKDDDRTISVFHEVEKRHPELANHCYFFAQTELVRRGEYQLCKKCIGDFQARYDVLQRGYKMTVQSAAQMAQLRHQIPVRQFRQDVNLPVPKMPDFDEQRKQTEHGHFVRGVCELVEILLATGSSDKAEDILRQAKETLTDARFDTAIADAQQRIASHRASDPSK
jgi:hypothetical protein